WREFMSDVDRDEIVEKAASELGLEVDAGHGDEEWAVFGGRHTVGVLAYRKEFEAEKAPWVTMTLDEYETHGTGKEALKALAKYKKVLFFPTYIEFDREADFDEETRQRMAQAVADLVARGSKQVGPVVKVSVRCPDAGWLLGQIPESDEADE